MEFILAAIAYVQNNIAQILQVVGGFAAIATLTPNKADDKIVQMVLDAINTFGGNFGNSKNGS